MTKSTLCLKHLKNIAVTVTKAENKKKKKENLFNQKTRNFAKSFKDLIETQSLHRAYDDVPRHLITVGHI